MVVFWIVLFEGAIAFLVSLKGAISKKSLGNPVVQDN